MQYRVSTEGVAERDRFPLWAEAVQSTLGLAAEPSWDPAQPFRATMSVRSGGPMRNLSVAADAHRISHSGRGTTHRPEDGYRIYREGSAGAWFSIAGTEGVTHTGDLVVYDTSLSLKTRPRDAYRLEMWLLPKAVLDPHLPATGRPLATILSGRSGVDALAAGYLDALTRSWDGMSEAAMGPVADTLARLIGIACGSVAAAQPDAVQAGRLVEARRHIDRHLADSDLSPTSVAAALGIAVRSLHAVFEPTGTSFARYVARRRLEECRAALLANPARAVTDIAFAWGFTSLSGFYRAFQAAFGMSPGDLRAASCAGRRC